MRRALQGVTLAFLLVVCLAACGGGSDKTSSAADTATSTTAGGAATTGAAAGSAGGATTSLALGSGGGAVCDKARAQLQEVFGDGSSKLADAFASFSDPTKTEQAKADLKKLLAEQAKKNADLVSSAPAEIKADLQTLLRQVDALVGAFEKANYDFQKVDFTALSAITQDPAVQAAADRVSTFYKDRCGIDLDALTG